MSVFPTTSMTLLGKLAVDITGEREAAWTRFFGLYEPAIHKFAEWHGSGQDPDDVVQQVFGRLVEVIQRHGYDRTKSSFRSYLAAMIRNEIVSIYRKEKARGADKKLSLDEIEEARINDEGDLHSYDAALALPAEQIAQIDKNWARAKHESAVNHILNKTAISRQNRCIYVEHVINGRSASDVARQFKVSKNLIGQVKFRVNKAIELLEMEFCDEHECKH